MTAVVVAASLAGASPAHAAVGGELAFECSARFPEWPGFGWAVCGDGVVPAVGTAELSGVDDTGVPFTVAGTGRAGTTFWYAEACIANEWIPVWPINDGRLTIHDVPATRAGRATTATIEVDFSAAVFGHAAIPAIASQTRVTFADGATASGLAGAGAGAMVPLVSPVEHDCWDGAPLDATMAFDFALAL